MRKLIDIIMRLTHYVISYSVIHRCANIRRRLYTAWIKNEFKDASGIAIGKELNLIGGKYISIGSGTGLGAHGTLQAWDRHNGNTYTPEISIGANCWIGDYFNISSINRITIGNNVLMGRWVTILDNDHGKSSQEEMCVSPLKRCLYSKNPITIGDRVWIGDKVTILAGINIGEGAIIGSNAVVTKDVPPYSIAVGVPAKIIKDYGI